MRNAMADKKQLYKCTYETTVNPETGDKTRTPGTKVAIYATPQPLNGQMAIEMYGIRAANMLRLYGYSGEMPPGTGVWYETPRSKNPDYVVVHETVTPRERYCDIERQSGAGG
jgi:hypothetical protein